MESAVYRPQASFGGQDLYATLFEKVEVLGHSLIMNHVFIDGNKRVGYAAMRLMLRLNGYDLKASQQQKYNFVMDIAKGELKEAQIVGWISEHART